MEDEWDVESELLGTLLERKQLRKVVRKGFQFILVTDEIKT
jgi:hypothetical protein